MYNFSIWLFGSDSFALPIYYVYILIITEGFFKILCLTSEKSKTLFFDIFDEKLFGEFCDNFFSLMKMWALNCFPNSLKIGFSTNLSMLYPNLQKKSRVLY
jgi:hypothetical protein